MEMKHCPCCGQNKPLDAFYKNKARKDGVQSRCKECERATFLAGYTPKKPTVSLDERTAAKLASGLSKYCPKCKKVKLLRRFAVNRTKSSGRQSYCRSCMSTKNNKNHKLRAERERIASVAGKMIAWQAADALGLTETQFMWLAKKHGISTAFVKPRWTEESIAELIELRLQRLTHAEIAARMNRTTRAVRQELRLLIKDGRVPVIRNGRKAKREI